MRHHRVFVCEGNAMRILQSMLTELVNAPVRMAALGWRQPPRIDEDPEAAVDAAIKAEEALLAQRYEREIMNPEEALSLGSISEIVMPADLRKTLATQMAFCLRHYTPGPMQSVQREFH